MAETGAVRKTWWALDVAVKVVAIVALLLSLVGLWRWNELGNCLADYADRSAAATGARADAAERDRLAQDKLWQAFADASDPGKVPPGQAGDFVRKAFAQFLSDRADANRQRAENPPPPPPAEVCR